MLILKIEEINPISSSSSAMPPPAIASQSAITISGSYRAGQRRLRTETAGTCASQTISDELVNVIVKYGNNPDGIPALLYAAKVGDLKAVELLVQHGADPYTRDHEKNTALHFALLSKNLQVVRFFLEKGLDPNASNNWLPIWYESIKFDDVESFKLLVEYGLKINTDSDLNKNPALAAVQCGSLNLLKFILVNGGNLPHTGMFNGQDPILWSITSRYEGKGKEKIECLKWLVSTGILNLKNTDEFDIANSYPEFVEYLLDNNHISINQRFHGINQYPIVYGAFHNPAILRLVIKRGADVNAKDAYGNTQLHIAATVSGPDQNYLESIKILLENGANPNLKDGMGRTPLSRAQDPRVKKLLTEYGAKI